MDEDKVETTNGDQTGEGFDDETATLDDVEPPATGPREEKPPAK